MSARTVNLRALVVEDIARTADRFNRPAAALLARRFPVDDAVMNVVGKDLCSAATREARVAGDAAYDLRDDGPKAAAKRLAGFCGLSVEEWTAETCREQGVEVRS